MSQNILGQRTTHVTTKIHISVKSSEVQCPCVLTVETEAPIDICSARSTFMLRAVTWDAIPDELPCSAPKPVDSVGSVSRCLDKTALSSVLVACPFAMLGLETVPNRRPGAEGARGVLFPTPCTDWDKASPLAPPFLPVHEDWKPPCSRRGQAWDANSNSVRRILKTPVVTVTSTTRRFQGLTIWGHQFQDWLPRK